MGLDGGSHRSHSLGLCAGLAAQGLRLRVNPYVGLTQQHFLAARNNLRKVLVLRHANASRLLCIAIPSGLLTLRDIEYAMLEIQRARFCSPHVVRHPRSLGISSEWRLANPTRRSNLSDFDLFRSTSISETTMVGHVRFWERSPSIAACITMKGRLLEKSRGRICSLFWLGGKQLNATDRSSFRRAPSFPANSSASYRILLKQR